MGSLFKKLVTRPLPAGAEIITRKGERLARWRDSKRKLRTAPVTIGQNGTDRIRDESATYVARYRDGNGLVVEVSTGCRDKTAAQSVLADLERQAEKVRAGLLTPAEARTAEHVGKPIAEHVDAYIESMQARGVVKMHRDNVRNQLSRVIADCGFARNADLNREALERWLANETKAGRSARSRNAHRAAMIAFCNWCSDPSIGRMVAHPFRGLPKADEKADPRRRRRAMSQGELARLVDVARSRPLVDALTVRRGKRKGEQYARLSPKTRQRLELLGRERALMYKTLVLSGLRKGELASLSVAKLRLDGPMPHVELDARDEKNREGNGVVIRADLAEDLKQWLADKLAALRTEALRRGEPIPATLPADTPVFDVPSGLVRIFDRDLLAAGIAKKDDRGRTLDVHALRTTFGTLLSRGGVPLRTAQAAMRHSDPSLTANVYTDPRLLDVHGALDALPSLPLGQDPDADRQRLQAVRTGTYGSSLVALPVALPDDKGCTMLVSDDKSKSPDLSSVGARSVSASGFAGTSKATMSSLDNPSLSIGPTGFEPVTSSTPS
jgi:integrase